MTACIDSGGVRSAMPAVCTLPLMIASTSPGCTSPIAMSPMAGFTQASSQRTVCAKQPDER
jgi:hypothetical protein